jgi:phage repressor protein C with HTH and peptisase S24 domain
MQTQGDRIRLARKARGWTLDELTKRSGVKRSAISEVERGKTQRSRDAAALARALGVNVDWLADGRGKMEAPGALDEDWPSVLAYEQPASLGPGAEPDEYAITHQLKFRAQSLARQRLKADNLGVCYGKGDSMLPRIRSGDAILFDRADTAPKNGKLYVVTYGRDLLAKKLKMFAGRWHIQSLNESDPLFENPEPIDEHKGLVIHGRVRWIGSWES